MLTLLLLEQARPDLPRRITAPGPVAALIASGLTITDQVVTPPQPSAPPSAQQRGVCFAAVARHTTPPLTLLAALPYELSRTPAHIDLAWGDLLWEDREAGPLYLLAPGLLNPAVPDAVLAALSPLPPIPAPARDEVRGALRDLDALRRTLLHPGPDAVDRDEARSGDDLTAFAPTPAGPEPSPAGMEERPAPAPADLEHWEDYQQAGQRLSALDPWWQARRCRLTLQALRRQQRQEAQAASLLPRHPERTAGP